MAVLWWLWGVLRSDWREAGEGGEAMMAHNSCLQLRGVQPRSEPFLPILLLGFLCSSKGFLSSLLSYFQKKKKIHSIPVFIPVNSECGFIFPSFPCLGKVAEGCL